MVYAPHRCSAHAKSSSDAHGVEIPLELNINVNTEIKWNGGNTSDEILLVIWTRPFEMEQWEILLSTSTPDDGSYMILSSLFENYMEEWHVAIELARGINETPDPLLRDGSELYSLFVFGQYTGKLISN